MATDKNAFTWDAKNARYRSQGKFVKASDVRAAVDSYVSSVGGNVGANLWQQLRDGTINVRDLQLIGERQIAIAHLAAAEAVMGGRKNMTFSDFGKVGSNVKRELQHWRDLMKQIADGRPIDGPLKASFRAYFLQAGIDADGHEKRLVQRLGFDEVKNILQDGVAHCVGANSCKSVTAKGWMPVDEMTPRGERACRYGCRCSFEWRNSATGSVRR